MERAIRAISVERGHDPRDFVLVAFGGAGPLHAAYLAAALGMRRVLVPRYPGVLSALGMLTADITRDYVQVIAQPLDTLAPADLSEQMRHLASQGWDDLRRDAGNDLPLRAVFALDLRYIGQSHEVTTPLAEWSQPDAALEEANLSETAARFHQLHEQQSGHAMPDHPIEVVSLRLKMVGTTGLHADLEQPPSDDTPPPTEPPAPRATVQAMLAAEDTTPQPTAIYERDALSVGHQVAGPAIIVQLDTTSVVPPGWLARVEPSGHLLLTMD
jgi:N-methylhydantoinase A